MLLRPLLAALSLAAVPLAALPAAAQAQPTRTTLDAVVATVNGEAITASEVEEIRLRSGATLSRREVLLTLVYRTILRQEARAAGVLVPDLRLQEAMKERVLAAGGTASYEAQLAELGVTADEDRVEIRDALMEEAFIDHCTGRVPGSPHLRAHLVRLVDVTPGEVRAFYLDHQEQFREPARLRIGQVVVAKKRFGGAEPTRAELEAIRARAEALGPAGLERAAAERGELEYRAIEVDASAEAGRQAELRTFLETAKAGALSPIIASENAFLLAQVLERRAERSLSFAEAQEAIRRALVLERRQGARAELARELLRGAEVWPEDLFQGS